MARRYHKTNDGEQVKLINNLGLFMCCDCGLVQIVKVTPDKKASIIQMWRDNRATAARRKRGRVIK